MSGRFAKMSSRRATPKKVKKVRKNYFVYVLECGDGSLYTGITTDTKRRLSEHQRGMGARFTRARGAVRVLYTERHPSRSAASKREAEIKKWERSKKLAFIAVSVKILPDIAKF